ncbi:MAG: hypothetical protein ACPGVG_08600 [Mycobacterium sp.]
MTLDLTPLAFRHKTKPRSRFWLWYGILLSAGFFFACVARAQGAEAPPPTVEPSSSAPELRLRAPRTFRLDAPSRLTLNDVPGMWFPLSTARTILADVRELQLGRTERRLADEEVAMFELRREHANSVIANLEEANLRREALIDRAGERARRLQAALDSWTRSPILWFAVGVLTTGAVVALTAYALAAGGGP